MKRSSKYPNTRKGWSDFYAARFNATESPYALQLALWHYMLWIAFGEYEGKGPSPKATA